MSDVKEKIWNIELVVADIELFPQTYKTILKNYCHDGTCQTILRRKLSKLCKNGIVCKTIIPGTRFGKILFYSKNKKYYILVDSERFGSVVYCFFKFKNLNKYYMKVSETWKLENSKWVNIGEKIFFEGNVLKFF